MEYKAINLCHSGTSFSAKLEPTHWRPETSLEQVRQRYLAKSFLNIFCRCHAEKNCGGDSF